MPGAEPLPVTREDRAALESIREVAGVRPSSGFGVRNSSLALNCLTVGRSGVDAPYVDPITDDDPGAEEADARDDAGGDSSEVDTVLRCGGRAHGEEEGKHLEECGTEGDQRIGAKPGHPRLSLPLGPNEYPRLQDGSGEVSSSGNLIRKGVDARMSHFPWNFGSGLMSDHTRPELSRQAMLGRANGTEGLS